MTRVWKTEGSTWGPCIRRQGTLVVSGAGSLCREERHLVQDKALKMVVAQNIEIGLEVPGNWVGQKLPRNQFASG